MDMMMMMDDSDPEFCVICKKVFPDKDGLEKHKWNQHKIPPSSSTKQSQSKSKVFRSNSNCNDNNDTENDEDEDQDNFSGSGSNSGECDSEGMSMSESSGVFRKNKNLTITRVVSGNATTTITATTVVGFDSARDIKKGTTMNQNQNPAKSVRGPASRVGGVGRGGGSSRTPSINERRAVMKLKMAEGRANANKAPLRNPSSSLPAPARGDDVGPRGANAKWQKWVNSSNNGRNGSTISAQPQPQLNDHLQLGGGGGGGADGNSAMIITPSAAERATSAFCSSAAELTPRGKVAPRGGGQNNIARKSVPHLIPMVPKNQNGKQTTRGGGVPDIMQNLGKIKSLNQQARSNPPAKLISVPPPPPVVTPPFRMGKPPQVPKNKGKILPRNAYNNALPKPKRAQQQPSKQPLPPPRLQVENEEVEWDDEEDEDLYTPPQLKPQQSQTQTQFGRKSAPPPPPPPSRNMNGKAKPPNQPPPPQQKRPPPKSGSTTNGKSSSNQVVAKKSTPKSGHKTRIDKMKEYIPKMPGTNYPLPSLSAVGSYVNREGQQVWVCLVCKGQEKEESSRDMICCDTCEDWYHWECVGVSNVNEDDPWYCKRCIFQASNNPTKDFPGLFSSNVPP